MRIGKFCSILNFIVLFLLFVNLAETSNNNVMKFSYEFEKPEIEIVGNYSIVSINGLDMLDIPGSPILPYKVVRILIPFNEKVERIEILPSEKIEIEGRYFIKPAPKITPYKIFSFVNRTVYNSNNNFPGLKKKFFIQRFRGRDILVLSLIHI